MLEEGYKSPPQMRTSVLSLDSAVFHGQLLIKANQASLKYQAKSVEESPACPFMAQKQGVTAQINAHSRKGHGNDTTEPPATIYQM